MKYSERDLIRYYTTKDRINKRKNRIKMQQSYCRANIKEGDSVLTPAQRKEIREYWEKISFAYDYCEDWCEMYTAKTGMYSPYYIPNELHYYFVENGSINFEYLRAFTDKNYLSSLFWDIKQPTTVLKRIKGLYYLNDFTPITEQQAITLLMENSMTGFVMKPSINSWGGRSIQFVHNTALTESQAKEMLQEQGNNYIVQKLLKQSAALNVIHSESVNTMRIITILLDGEVNVLSACLRMGVGKSEVDNFSQGGVGCGIGSDGRLKPVGFDRWGNRVDCHPSGFHFENCVIPNFDGVLATVKKAAIRVPQFGVASWDFALDDENTPVLIEYNVSQGGIDIHQYNNGPLYGDKTDHIIERTFKNYCFEDTTLPYNYNVFSDHVTVKTGSKDMTRITVEPRHHDRPVTRIGTKAFEGAALTGIVLPSTVQYIDYCAFYNCVNLKNVTLPSSLVTIGRSAFNGCRRLTKVTIPFGTKTIGARAFKGINGLTVSIPATVSDIADTAFEDYAGLTLCGQAKSYAEEYAVAHHIPFVRKKA